MELIRLTKVSFRYPGQPAVLHDLDFSLAKGQRVGIMGPNGSGKSTMCLVIMGLVRAGQGRIEAFGQPRHSEKDFQMVRTRLGFCFQDPDDQLFSPSVLEDVAFGPLNQGKSKQEAKRLAHSTLEQLGLTGLAHRVPYRLSGGEKRLVSLATVWSMQPEALLLDEPTSGLDPKTQHRLEHLLADNQLTYAIISHDRQFLSRTCSELWVMRDGRLGKAYK